MKPAGYITITCQENKRKGLNSIKNIRSESMKEIKFRAWDSTSMWDIEYINFPITYIRGLSQKKDDDGYFEQMPLSKKAIVMQFIRLRDKNGKDIYEGDLLKHETGFISEIGKNKLSEVVWHELGWYYKWIELEHLDEESGLMNKSQITYTKIYDSDKNVEIVGNIYENPDLLNNLLE